MFSAFFESIKYVGHQFPLAFLRIYLGYYWLHQYLGEYRTGLFSSQVFADELKSSQFLNSLPQWYQWLFDNVIYPYWAFVSHGILISGILVGISLIIGFLVRPFSIIAIIISLHFIWYGFHQEMYSAFTAILATFVIAGAGRCVGFDYYFYKRNRGVWW